MTYLDTLLLIEERAENILAQDSRTLITNTRRYLRTDGNWAEDLLPGTVEKRYTKGGEQYYWKRTEESNV